MTVFPARVSHAVLHEISLHLPEPPSVNHYYTVARGRKILSAAGRAYKLAVKAAYLREFRTTKIALPDGPIAVQMVWTRGRKSGDLDNRWKALLDALKGLAYADDQQIIEQHGYRRDAKGQPGIQVVISRTTAESAFTSPTYSG